VADYFWKGGVSQQFSDEKNWMTTSGGSTAHTVAPGTTSDLFFDAATLANQCDFATANGLTVKSITVQDGLTASTLFNTAATSSLTIKDTLTVNEHTVFAFAQTFTFIFNGSGTQFTVYDGDGTNDASVPDAYIKLGLNAGESMFSSETVRGRITFDFTQDSGTNSMTLVDGVYPNMTNIGTVHAKFITSDANATAFNTYGSVDMLNWSGGSVTSTSRNVHDYDKEFFFEALTSVGETFQFGHTTARFKSGSANFRLPVLGDARTDFGNITTNTFNVQYHKVVIEAGDNTTNYAFIQLGKTLDCNELVIRDGGRLYGPAEGHQTPSSKIKSVKRPTVQGDWNFKQIADGIYESIGNIPTLPVTEGGTGLNTLAVGRIPFGNGQLPLQTLSTLNYNTSSNTLNAVNAHFTGKLTVDGLIDPTGMEFSAVSSNPGTDQAKTIWVNSADSNKLYFGNSEVGGGGGGGLSDVVDDTTPQLGGDLDVNGNKITSASNADVTIEPNGTGDVNLFTDTVIVGDSNTNFQLQHRTTTASILQFQSGGNTRLNSDGNIYLNTNQGGGSNTLIRLNGNTITCGTPSANVTISTQGAGDLTLNTNSGTNSGTIKIADGVNGDITIVPNGTGKVGIGTSSPQANLHVSSETSGDAIVIIEADSDNNNSDGSDNDTPQLWFKADGGINEGALRLNNNHLELISNVGSLGSIKLMTGTTNNTGSTDPGTGATVRLQIAGSGAITFNNEYTFPTSDGNPNQVLTTDGNGTLTFQNAGGGGSDTNTFVIFGEESDDFITTTAAAGNANGFQFSYGNGAQNTTKSSIGSDFGIVLPVACTLSRLDFTFGNKGSESNFNNQTFTVFKNLSSTTTTVTFNAGGTGGNAFKKSFASLSGTGVSYSAGDTFNLRTTGLSGYTLTQIGPARMTAYFTVA